MSELNSIAAQYRGRTGVALGHVDQPEAQEVEEFVEVEPTGQARVVEADETEDED